MNLTARSGFTENVSLEYVWGGPESKRHFLCGQDGKREPNGVRPRILRRRK